MITEAEAVIAARKYIEANIESRSGQEIFVVENEARSRGSNTVAPFNTAKYLETGNPVDGFIGNRPVKVNRETAEWGPTETLAYFEDQ
ncbi:hypothetical protein GCM10027570_50890 [Streptomonospora sediminis]